MSRDTYDIAIVGGGLVGSTLACALAPLGYRTVVIEAVSPRAELQPSYDDRTLALSQASCRILQGLGLWPRITAEATPIREVIVTELGRPGRVCLQPGELGLESFGHVVEARAFGRAVLDQLATIDQVEVRCPSRVTAIETESDCIRLTLNDEAGEQALQAALVVAADGAGSTVRQLLSIATREKDYGQVAVICNVTPTRHHRGRAFERMTPTGPFAVLPHRGDRCGLVWCVPTDDATELMEMPEEEFLCQATQRSGGELGEFTKMGQRSSYPLKLVLAEEDARKRVLILGNAAHAIHPAGAQGFNLGLRDVAVLAEILAGTGAGEAAPDPGKAALLEAYGEWRRPDRNATVAWTDGMVSLFSSHHALSGLARTMGLMAHSVLPPLRRRLASQAMGYRGRTPRLALGEPLVVADKT